MDQQRSEHPNLVRPLRCIVKLGGAAITCKNDLEKINEAHLEMVAAQLRQVMISGSSKVPGMDWSKRSGKLEISLDVDEFRDQELLETSSFIVVHGAGSFGHFQASQSGVHKGGLKRPIVKAGFVATRISFSRRANKNPKQSEVTLLTNMVAQFLEKENVSTLNLEVVRALAREGLPSIGISPFSCGWSTREKNIASANLSAVAETVDSGFIPVLHGDAVLDELQGCTILSGDVIIRHLAENLKPNYVVFLTDVFGVYDRPPAEPDAVLLKEIAVRGDGSWSVVKPPLEDNDVEMTVAAHDTTGGMKTKISEAAIIAKLGIDVYIVKAATTHSIRALSGDLKENIPDDWLGTAIRFAG